MSKNTKKQHKKAKAQSPQRASKSKARSINNRLRHDEEWDRPAGVLRFTPSAWAKLHYFCHAGDTEIGGFGLTDPDDPLLVIDFLTVKQSVTSVSVEFDDESVADLFEQQVDAGYRPDHFARIWCHTHPGNSPDPSGTDEETFARVFGNCDWAVMFILAKGGQTYCRLGFRAGPGGSMNLDVVIDYDASFVASDHAAWSSEYDAHIHPELRELPRDLFGASQDLTFDPYDWVEVDTPLDLDQHRAQIEQLIDAGYDPDEIESFFDYEIFTDEVTP